MAAKVFLMLYVVDRILWVVAGMPWVAVRWLLITIPSQKRPSLILVPKYGSGST